MRKFLLPLALTGFMLSGISFSADALTATNLCPNFEFNKAETPLQFVGQTPDFNLPVEWVHNNVINGNIDATGGILMLSGGAGPMNNFPNTYKKMNENLRILNLGGTCGKVWAVSHNDETMQALLKSEYDIDIELPKMLHDNGWFKQYVYFFVPDPDVMKNYQGKTLRCRMEINLYRPTGSSDADAMYAYSMNDQNSTVEAAYSTASAHRVKYSEFYTDGKWDPTKWMVYEFELPVTTPDENGDWTSAPRIKVETAENLPSCHLIRNVIIYDPEAATDVEPVDLTTHKFVTYSVGPEIVEPDPIVPDDPVDPFNNADDISGHTFISTGLHFNAVSTAPKFHAKNSATEWNLPKDWIYTNIINGDVPNRGGSLILSGDGSIKDYDCLDKFNEHVHHVNLGGTCTKVMAINFKGTNLSGHLSSNHSITFPANGFESVWGSTGFNLFVVPDYIEMAQYSGKTLRVRIELNMYENNGAATMAFKAWGTDDDGNTNSDDVTYAGEHTVKAADFLDANGKWDPTKWRAYEFDMNVPTAPSADNLSSWTTAPDIKLDVAGCKNGTLLIRNIYIWDPTATPAQAARRVSPSTRYTEKWVRYEVGPVQTALDLIKGETETLVTVSGNMASFTQDAEVYDLAGRKVASCAANDAVELPAGFYLGRTATGAAAKFVVR